jgi:drug/metabolite transporter (DMT)-like permease
VEATVPKLSGRGKEAEIALSVSPVRFALLIFTLTMLLFVGISIASGLDRAPAAIGYGLLTALLVSFAAGGIGCLSSRAVLLGYAAILVAILGLACFVLDDDSMFDSEETLAARLTVFLVVLLGVVIATLAAAVWGWYRYLARAKGGEGGDHSSGKRHST